MFEDTIHIGGYLLHELERIRIHSAGREWKLGTKGKQLNLIRSLSDGYGYGISQTK